MTVVFSGHDLARTRDCAAPGCVLEAETASEFCRDHQHDQRRARPAWTQKDTPERREILDWIRGFADRHGRSPYTTDLDPYAAPFPLSRARFLFGNFGNAVEAAGCPRPVRGVRHRHPSKG